MPACFRPVPDKVSGSGPDGVRVLILVPEAGQPTANLRRATHNQPLSPRAPAPN